jgi:large subunit ribosomal protein L5
MTKVLSLKEKFQKELAPQLQKQLKIKNINAVPKLTKVVLNVGIGKMLAGGKDYSEVEENVGILVHWVNPVLQSVLVTAAVWQVITGMIIPVRY